MAVEIPVVIDIEKAFEEAAAKVRKAVKPLQDTLSKEALNLRFKVDEKSSRTVKKLLDGSTTSAKQLNTALRDVSSRISSIAANGGFIPGNLTARERDLLNIFTQLQMRIKGTSDVMNVFGKNVQKSFKNMVDGGKEVSESYSRANEAIGLSNSRLGLLIKNSLRLIALHSATTFIRNVREVTSEFELQRVALGSIIQDTERAEGLFRQIKAAAVESPFEVKDLVTYTKQLSAYQIETDKLFETTMKLADVSAGLGVDMNRLILAYGQVRAASVLRGQELRQFTEAGIPLVDKLAEKFTELNNKTVTTAEVFDLISKRAVPFRMIEEIFNDMTSAGGMFYKMQEKQAETLLGQWNNLKDSLSIMYDEIGRTDVVHNAMTTLIRDARWLMQHWRDIANVVKVAGGAFVAYVGVLKLQATWAKIVAAAELAAAAAESKREVGIRRLITRIIGKTTAEKISRKATLAHAAAMKAADAAATSFGKTMWRLVAILAKNPFGLAAIAVAALASSLLTLAKRGEDVEESINKADKSIQGLEKARGYDELIGQYEELSRKTNRTAKEEAALRDISRELGKAFPQTTKAIDNQTGALILNIEQLKNYSEEAQNTIKESMRAQITANKSQIERFESQQEHIQKVLGRGYGFVEGSFYFGLNKDVKNAEVLRQRLIAAADGVRNLTQKNQELQDAIDGVKRTTGGEDEPYPPIGDPDRLNKLRKSITDVTNAYKKFLELLEYESKSKALSDIGVLFPSLSGWEPTYENMVSKLEGMLDQYKGDADATRIIEQALANVKFDKLKKDFDDKLKKLSDDIKKSETARNFYKNMLDLTGDEDIAQNMTVSVYGGIGKDFKDRIQEQLYRALTELEPEDIDKDLMSQIMGDITIFDIDDIEKNLDKLPPKVQEVFKKALEENQKYNADWLLDFEKTYASAKTYEDRVNRLQKQRQDKENEARSMGKSPEEIAAVTAYYNQEIAKVQLEAMKDTYTWTKAFEDLDGVSSRTLENLIELIDEYIKKYGKDLAPGQLKQLTRQREQARAQQLQRNSIAGISDAISKLSRKENAYNIMLEHGMDLSGALAEIQDEQLKSLKELGEAYEEATNEMNQYISGAKDLMTVFASDEDASFFGGILDNLQKTMGGVGKAGTGILGVLINPTNTKAWAQAFSGISDVVSGIFGAINAAKMRRINREIEHQQDLLDDLQGSYNRLEKAMAKSFGSDYIYNYNKQLENLVAQQAAYEEQARLEREKGKKADESKIEDYEKSARSTAEQIAETNGKLAEYFSGTDITSAAKDFATSWIEAYREFGSTTDAMKEKFQDMVENMVTQSLAAKVMQSILDPLFRQIDEMAASDEMLSAQEIATIANLAPEYIDQINAAMTNLMNQLGAAGYNLRQGAGSFTGISRSVAGASEESITGLAAGINTQNFYMSLISQNVAAILAAMTGETVEGATGATVPDPYKEQVLTYIGSLPQMRDDMYAIRTLLERVIKPNGTSATHYVATRM